MMKTAIALGLMLTIQPVAEPRRPEPRAAPLNSRWSQLLP